MKISIRREDETTGWLRKTTEYVLYVKVELSGDERAAIKKAGIEDYLLMPYSYKETDIDWTVKSVIYSSDKGTERRFVTLNAASRDEMEDTIKDKLSALKSNIVAELGARTGSESYDL